MCFVEFVTRSNCIRCKLNNERADLHCGIITKKRMDFIKRNLDFSFFNL